MSETVGKRLALAMESAGIKSDRELADRLERITHKKISPQAIQKLRTDKAKASNYLPQMAYVCNVSSIWLAEGVGDIDQNVEESNNTRNTLEIASEPINPQMTSSGEVDLEAKIPLVRRVPLISWVQAGNWGEIVDNFEPGDAEEWVNSTKEVTAASFALTVVGDSMVNPSGYKSISEGYRVIVDPNERPENGDIVVARLEPDMEATLKRLVMDGPNRYLRPLNPDYKTIEIDENCTIVGVAVEVVFSLKK